MGLPRWHTTRRTETSQHALEKQKDDHRSPQSRQRALLHRTIAIIPAAAAYPRVSSVHVALHETITVVSISTSFALNVSGDSQTVVELGGGGEIQETFLRQCLLNMWILLIWVSFFTFSLIRPECLVSFFLPSVAMKLSCLWWTRNCGNRYW